MSDTGLYNLGNNGNNISPDKIPLAQVKTEPGNYNLNYHSLFEQATDAIIVTDFTGNFVDVNSSCCAMFGYLKEELLMMNARELIDHENLRAQPIPFDILAAGETILSERKMIHKNGTIIYVESNAKKFFDEYVLVIARDITRRKETEWILQKSEANLHTIFDTTDTIYVLMDNDFRIISYNPRACDFAMHELGHSLEISEYFLDYFPQERRPALLSHMREVLTGKSINYEISYPQPDGSFNWYHVRMFPISKGDNHIVYGVMMAVSDITEKIALEKRLEEERLRKQEEITDAVITAEENERQEIGRELHDNVNQLLASARLYINTAKRSAAMQSHPNLDEADCLIHMAINEIRNLSHALISPFLEEYGILKAVDHLITIISKTSRITVRTKIQVAEENKIPEKLRLTLYRAIQEQFANILKYAKAETIYLVLLQENKKIILSIKDDGIGFDTSKKSMGIGFINIRTRASLFKGTVNIISSPGNGCELNLQFDR